MSSQGSVNGLLNHNNSNEFKKEQNTKKSQSRERVHLSQERIQKRESGK